MGKFESKFSIGDVIVTEAEAESWAVGERETPPTGSPVNRIIFTEEGIFLSTQSSARLHPEHALIPQSDLKSFAIQYLTNRLQGVASLGEKGEPAP